MLAVNCLDDTSKRTWHRKRSIDSNIDNFIGRSQTLTASLNVGKTVCSVNKHQIIINVMFATHMLNESKVSFILILIAYRAYVKILKA